MARNNPTATDTATDDDFLNQQLVGGETVNQNSVNSPIGTASGSKVVPLNQRAEDAQFKAQIRELLNEGKSRPQIAKLLGVKYQLVYAATKDMMPANSGTYSDGTPRTGGRITITLPDGEVISRQDYIKREFAKGRKRVDIANELNVAYQIVFQATKDAAKQRTGPAIKIDETEEGELRYLITGADSPIYANTRAEAEALLESIKAQIKAKEDAKKTSIKPVEMSDGGLKFEVKVGNYILYAKTRAEANEIAVELQNKVNEELGLDDNN